MNFSDIKGFAFDLDGVIADTARFHGQAWHQLADKVGTKWTDELANNLKGVGRMDSLEMILKAGGHENDYTQDQKVALATEKNDNYLKLVATLTPKDILPGMKDFLDELKAANYQMVLASASKNAPKVLKYLKLTDYFQGIVDPATLSKSKPDPEIYTRSAELMKLPANQVAGVEDAQAGVDSINAAGELSIGIGANLKGADIKFNSTADVSLDALKNA